MSLFTETSRVDEVLARVLEKTITDPGGQQALADAGVVQFDLRTADETRSVTADFVSGAVSAGAADEADVTMTIDEFLVHEILVGAVAPLPALAGDRITITGDLKSAVALTAGFPVIAGAWRSALPDGDGGDTVAGTAPPTTITLQIPKGAPSRLTSDVNDQMLLVAATIAALPPQARDVQLSALFAQHAAGDLSERHLARLLVSLADLATGTSDHDRRKAEIDSEQQAQQQTRTQLDHDTTNATKKEEAR